MARSGGTDKGAVVGGNEGGNHLAAVAHTQDGGVQAGSSTAGAARRTCRCARSSSGAIVCVCMRAPEWGAGKQASVRSGCGLPRSTKHWPTAADLAPHSWPHLIPRSSRSCHKSRWGM